MKRLFLFLLLAACSGAEDDSIGDASLDQSQESSSNDATVDVTKQDVTTSDVTQQDAQSDVAQQDATTDAITVDVVADAIVDVITVDVKNGCVDNNACNNNQFCDKGTSNCGGVGKCTAIPQFCPQIVMPVCGCDKKTYTNSCYANKGLTSVAYSGACE
jgi:hypothetical protein